MKVVIFTHAAGSPEHGPNLRWYYLGKRLKELGCDVTIVGSSFFHKYVVQPEVDGLFEEKVIDGLEYVFLKNLKYRGFFGRLLNQFFFPLMCWIWVLTQGKKISPDVVVSSSPPPFCIFPAYTLAKKNDSSLISEVRDLWPLVVQELSGASSRHPYVKILKFTEKFAVNNSNIVVSVKPGDLKYFSKEYGLSEDRFSFQPNGFLPEPDGELERNEEDISRGRSLVVGYVGAMSAYYGLKEFLETACLLKGDPFLKFVLVGSGEDYESLVKMKETHDLDNVEFVGRVPKNDVPKYLFNFDICYVGLKDVTANLHGISCNKIFEYMYAGKPIVASYRTLFDPVEQAGCGITVAPGSPTAIKDAILELKNSSEKRREMGINARAYFDANHDFNVIGDGYFKKMTELRNNA